MKQSHAAISFKPNKPAKGFKWHHHRELIKNSKISEHLSSTMKLYRQSLFSMLSRYKTVYLKPNQGAFGVGVIQVRKIGYEHFRVHLGSLQKKSRSLDEVYVFALANRINNDYLVQQGIDLLRWNKRPFDLRL